MIIKNIFIFDLSSQKNDFFNLGNYQGLGGQSNVGWDSK